VKGPLVIGPVLELGKKEGIPISLRVSISRFSKFMERPSRGSHEDFGFETHQSTTARVRHGFSPRILFGGKFK
jgi:hypothetical protein